MENDLLCVILVFISELVFYRLEKGDLADYAITILSGTLLENSGKVVLKNLVVVSLFINTS